MLQFYIQSPGRLINAIATVSCFNINCYDWRGIKELEIAHGSIAAVSFTNLHGVAEGRPLYVEQNYQKGRVYTPMLVVST